VNQTLRCHGQGLILFAEAGSKKKIASALEVYSTSQQPVEGSATCSELAGPRTRENMRRKGLKFDGWLGSEEPGASYCWHLYVFPGEVIQIPHTLMLGWTFSPGVRNWLTRTYYSVHKDGLLGTSKIKVQLPSYRSSIPVLPVYACILKMRIFSTIVLQALALTVSCRRISRAAAQPVVDLGYAIHQATLNVSYQVNLGKFQH
jgi:hypothetical protein